MGEIKNPVLDFDWKRDLEKVPPPHKGVVQPLMSGQEVTEGLLRGTTNNLNWRIQKDPKDFLNIQGLGVKIPVHALVWKETLDKYLWQYYCLKFAQSESETQDDWITVYLPGRIITKLSEYEKKRTEPNAKYMPVNTAFLQIADKNAPNHYYKTPAIGHACYLNLLFRYLDTRETASNLLLTPQYDGSKYCSETNYPLPTFELIDYCQHEYTTAISLTIEIASVFVEVRNKLYDDLLWDKVFELFSEKVLPRIVQSNLIFTRITVARLFFLQILVEETRKSYEWDVAKPKSEERDKQWEYQINRACSFLDLLDNPPKPSVIPADQVEASLAHIESLLGRMDEPIQFAKLHSRNQRGLAIFCNKKHENVKYYLDCLEKPGFDRIPMDSTNTNNKLFVFSRVRQAVKKALQIQNNPQILAISEDDILGKNPTQQLKIQINRVDPDDEFQR